MKWNGPKGKLCQRMHGLVFTTCLIGFTVQLSWRMMMNGVGWKNFVEKPPTFVPRGKSPVMSRHFCRTTINPPLFSPPSAFSWRLVWESLLWEWAHGSFFGLCLAPFCHFFFPRVQISLASMKYWIKVLLLRIVLCDFRMSGKNRVGDISDIWKG